MKFNITIRSIEIGRMFFSLLPQWRWKGMYSSTCYYMPWIQWACFEFAIERSKPDMTNSVHLK